VFRTSNAELRSSYAGRGVYTDAAEEVGHDEGNGRGEAEHHMAANGTSIPASCFFIQTQPQSHVVRAHRDTKLDGFTDSNFLRAIAHAIDKPGRIKSCFSTWLAFSPLTEWSRRQQIFTISESSTNMNTI